MHECLYTSEAHQQCTGIQLTVLYIKAYLLLFFVSFCTCLGQVLEILMVCEMKKKNLFHTVIISFLFKFIAIHKLSNLKCFLLPTLPQRRSMRVQRKQSTFEDDICCVSNIIVYDKVSDDFIFLSIKGTCPNQNLVSHHQFLDNLPGKASMQAFIYKVTGNLQGF